MHSLRLMQSTPVAEAGTALSSYPAMHAHVNEPAVLSHVASVSQLCVLSAVDGQ